MDKKIISVRLDPEISAMLSEFQARYHLSSKKRISQSEVINKALLVFINQVYKEWQKMKESNGK